LEKYFTVLIKKNAALVRMGDLNLTNSKLVNGNVNILIA